MHRGKVNVSISFSGNLNKPGLVREAVVLVAVLVLVARPSFTMELVVPGRYCIGLASVLSSVRLSVHHSAHNQLTIAVSSFVATILLIVTHVCLPVRLQVVPSSLACSGWPSKPHRSVSASINGE